MGGADTEVTDGTTRLLLECAWFEPRRIRRGARALGLSTEASKRFERGVDPLGGPSRPRASSTLLAEVSPGLRLGRGPRSASGARPRAARSRCAARAARASSASRSRSRRPRRHLEALDFDLAAGARRAAEPPRLGDRGRGAELAAGRHARGRPGRGGRALARLRPHPRGAARDPRRPRRARPARARRRARAARHAGARLHRGLDHHAGLRARGARDRGPARRRAGRRSCAWPTR